MCHVKITYTIDTELRIAATVWFVLVREGAGWWGGGGGGGGVGASFLLVCVCVCFSVCLSVCFCFCFVFVLLLLLSVCRVLDDDDRFYIALFSALEQTHCARM